MVTLETFITSTFEPSADALIALFLFKPMMDITQYIDRFQKQVFFGGHGEPPSYSPNLLIFLPTNVVHAEPLSGLAPTQEKLLGAKASMSLDMTKIQVT